MAKKNQSLKDRLQRYVRPPVDRSFFSGLSAEAQAFVRECRDLYFSGEMPLSCEELLDAFRAEYPDEHWPSHATTLTKWLKAQQAKQS
jgi:hypothetical protein